MRNFPYAILAQIRPPGLRVDRRFLAVAALFALALAVRVYQLAGSPLWFDELYGYRLALDGFRDLLWHTTRIDPHPPLYYLIQWAAAGFGAFHSEWGWRWLSVACGVLALPFVYLLGRRASGSGTAAFVAAALAAFSPAMVFFSQEARPYALLILLSAVTLWMLPRLQQAPASRAWWIAYVVATLAGLYCGYSYLPLAAFQFAYLALTSERRRPLLLAALAVVAGYAPWIIFGARALGAVAAKYLDTDALGLRLTAQALLAGDPVRYGFAWPHDWIPPVLLALAALGALGALRRRDRDVTLLFYAALVILPPLVFFAIGTRLLGIRLPLFEAKQFAVLLPPFYPLVAAGVQRLLAVRRRAAGPALAVLACAIVLAGSYVNLERYWHTAKGMESVAALAVLHNLRPLDAVVSLHYATDAAALFYLEGAPSRAAPELHLSSEFITNSGDYAAGAPLARVQSHERVWVLARIGYAGATLETVTRGCVVLDRWDYRPFETLLLSHCPGSGHAAAR